MAKGRGRAHASNIFEPNVQTQRTPEPNVKLIKSKTKLTNKSGVRVREGGWGVFSQSDQRSALETPAHGSMASQRPNSARGCHSLRDSTGRNPWGYVDPVLNNPSLLETGGGRAPFVCFELVPGSLVHRDVPLQKWSDSPPHYPGIPAD